MGGSLNIEADLDIRAGSDSISVKGRGRGIVVEVSSLAFLRQLPPQTRSLAGLRRLAVGLRMSDQAVLVTARGTPILDLDPARRERWLGRLLRVPGLKIHIFNWLRNRG